MSSAKQTKGRKTIFPLFQDKDVKEDHAILKNQWENEPEPQIPQKFIQEQREINSSVWPTDNNIVIESAHYENSVLQVQITNLSTEPIPITSAGVKYTNSMAENIDFQPQNFQIFPGENTIPLNCSRGKPFKFVFRTANMTGTGSSLDSLSW